jgi:hypothetical protein
MRGDDLFGAVGIAAFAVLFFVLIVWHFSRSRGLLEKWAAANGFRIIESNYRNLVRGPFFWTTSKGQTVYRVTVEDARGQRRSGWVRCGGFFLGLLSDRVTVRWDDEQ